MSAELTDEQRWARIRDAWILYCQEGAGAFDWDYDSRDLMKELTDHRAFEGRSSSVREGE